MQGLVKGNHKYRPHDPTSIDDIEDNSKLRRGIPVAHSIYGVAHTINSANYVYFLALERTLAMGRPKGMEIFTSIVHVLWFAQLGYVGCGLF